MTYFRTNIESMSGYVPGEQPQEEGFVKLNTNENPYPPSPTVAAAVNEVLKRGLRKYPDPMAGAFAARQAKHWACRRIGSSPETAATTS